MESKMALSYSAPKHIQLKIERQLAVLLRLGLSRSSHYSRIKEGLLPPSISLGSRAVGYFEHETNTVLAAMIAGKSKDEIKELVKSLVAQRQELVGTSL